MFCTSSHNTKIAQPTLIWLATSRAGKEGWSLQDLLADFHLLLFLCDFLDLNYDIPQLCRSVMQRDLPLDDGYQLIIRSVAGIDM